ncbi:hypothetical protein TNCV_2938621, partial [Trichonephila clavipes]
CLDQADTTRLGGLWVCFSLWVREAPGSIPGRAHCAKPFRREHITVPLVSFSTEFDNPGVNKELFSFSSIEKL